MLTVRKSVSTFIAALVAFVSLGLAPAYAVDERVIDVVSVTWPRAGALAGDVNKIASVIDTEVNADWIKFTSMYGAVTDRAISFKTGQILKDPIPLLSKMACTGYLASDFMSSIRPEAYKRLGISDYSKRYLVVVAPNAGCVWSGRAQLGGPKSVSGTLILTDTASSFVITHELGHTFGLGHSNFLRCDDAAYDGPWGDRCKAVEYGGTIDVMGNVDTTSPLSTYHQWRMGLIDDSQIKQVWQSENVTLSPSDFANGTKAIFIKDGKAAYWIEYRRKTDGVRYKPGLAIYRLDPPPISSIVSPNPEDQSASEFGSALGTDMWMLNLDSYKYSDSRAVSGSMTALTATTYSGDVSISAVATETNAVVTIKKKVDVTPPPTPVLVPVVQWQSPNMSIIAPGNDDADTAITGFEGQINGVAQPLKASDIDGWEPTYLSPFVAPKTLNIKELPEGSYSFAIRAIDIAGNKSQWSTPVDVVIDRAHPVVTNSFAVSTANTNEVTVAWKGATDTGAGICQVNVVDEDGVVIQSSTAKNAPVFKLANRAVLTGTAQVFDCVGNGQTGQLSITSSYIAASKSSRTGKWVSATTPFGAGAMNCVGKCTASINMTGKFDVLLGSGAATVAVGGKTVASISESKTKSLVTSRTIDAGAAKKVVRISGSNFVLLGLASLSTTLGELKEIDRPPLIKDISLLDQKQAKLAQLGFRADDFSPEWSVLPMNGGTTLVDPSLDLCNGTFASEKQRVERRQVTATKEGSTFTFLSTEVVKYSSAAAAAGAQKELVKVLAQCQLDKGYKDSTGTLMPYEFKTLGNIPAGVVSENNRLFVHTVIDSEDRARTLLGFYQFNGDTFTGLYVMNTKGFTDAQVAKWLRVAVTMATRLSGSSF
jgi:hypothetical protein